MKITGIIVEYNPLHLGHLHHIRETRRLTDCDILIAVMSPNFTQRGEIACVDKFLRTQAALKNGVDIVLELPTVYATQSAQVFAHNAIKILKLAGVDTIVFGSESNDLETLTEISEYPLNLEHFKELLATGHSYAYALNPSDDKLYPNDILGIAYIRQAKKVGIHCQTIQRTNHYLDTSLDNKILSASAIRNARANHIETNQSLVDLSSFIDSSSVYPYLRYTLVSRTQKELSNILLVSEGIENLLKENAFKYDTYEDFINASISKRYSRSRIQRICTHILLNHTKEMVANLLPLDFVRVLGFRAEASYYIKQINNVAMKVKEIPKPYFDIELNATKIYSLINGDDSLVNQEIGKVIII